MKRLFTLGLAIMAFGATSFANNNSTITERLVNPSTQNAIARYLDADYQQKSDLKYIFNEASKRYAKAISRGASEAEASKMAMNFKLANTKVVLSPAQYRKFISVLNITVMNDNNYSLFAEK